MRRTDDKPLTRRRVSGTGQGHPALISYRLKFFVSTYNDFVHDNPAFQKLANPFAGMNEPQWLEGPGRASWDAVGVWEANLALP